MILVAGGSGRLGREVVRLLRARGEAVRVTSRDPARAAAVLGEGVEVVRADAAQPDSLERATQGADVIVSAIHGFESDPRVVDRDGNAALVRGAAAHGAGRFVLVSIHGVVAHHAVDMFRMKHAAERAVVASPVPWTIVRPTAFMETWASILGGMIDRGGRGKATLFGRGQNPIHFVSVQDVTWVVARAARDPALVGRTIDVGGPEALTFDAFVDVLGDVRGRRVQRRRVPVTALRVGGKLLGRVRPAIARTMRSGVMMDTYDVALDPRPLSTEFPDVPRTRLVDVARAMAGRS